MSTRHSHPLVENYWQLRIVCQVLLNKILVGLLLIQADKSGINVISRSKSCMRLLVCADIDTAKL